MKFKLCPLTFFGIVAVLELSKAQTTRTIPTQTDKDGLKWLNVARKNPKSLIPDLQAILCSKWNTVESPGIAYDLADGTCSFFLGLGPTVASFIHLPFISKATTDEFCDKLVRTIFFIPPAAKPTCKTLNMNPTTKIYKTKNGVNMQTNEGVTAVNEAINFLKTVKPTYALSWNLDLWKSCQDHVLD